MLSASRRLPALRRLAGIFLIAISVFLLGSGPVYAQSTTASLSGRVFDAGLALLPDVTVVLTNRETATSRNTTSDSTGTFRIAALPPGVYDLRLARAGFSALQLEITLVMGEDRRVDLTMTIGRIDTTVTVVAGESLVDPSGTVLGRRITAREIADLPIQGRLFLNLALLTPGILNSYNTTASGSGFAAAGQTGRNNTLLIDGLALDDLNSATPAERSPAGCGQRVRRRIKRPQRRVWTGLRSYRQRADQVRVEQIHRCRLRVSQRRQMECQTWCGRVGGAVVAET